VSGYWPDINIVPVSVFVNPASVTDTPPMLAAARKMTRLPAFLAAAIPLAATAAAVRNERPVTVKAANHGGSLHRLHSKISILFTLQRKRRREAR
jgi:hypothetical protein